MPHCRLSGPQSVTWLWRAPWEPRCLSEKPWHIPSLLHPCYQGHIVHLGLGGASISAVLSSIWSCPPMTTNSIWKMSSGITLLPNNPTTVRVINLEIHLQAQPCLCLCYFPVGTCLEATDLYASGWGSSLGSSGSGSLWIARDRRVVWQRSTVLTKDPREGSSVALVVGNLAFINRARWFRKILGAWRACCRSGRCLSTILSETAHRLG